MNSKESTRDGRTEADNQIRTYRKRDSEQLAYDVRQLLGEHDAVEVWSDEERLLASAESKSAVYELEDGNRGVVVDGEHVRPEDVVELVALDDEQPVVTTDTLDDDTAPDVTSVYVHREATSDRAVSDFVFCSFGQSSVEGLDAPSHGSVTEWVETQVMQQFDGDDEQLDELLPTEAARVDEPPRVGRLFFDRTTGRVVALELDADAFDDSTDDRAELKTGAHPRDVSRLIDAHDHPDAPEPVTHLSLDGDITLCDEPRKGLRPFPLVGDDEDPDDPETLAECDRYVAMREDMCPACRRRYFGSDPDSKSWRQRLAEISEEEAERVAE